MLVCSNSEGEPSVAATAHTSEIDVLKQASRRHARNAAAAAVDVLAVFGLFSRCPSMIDSRAEAPKHQNLFVFSCAPPTVEDSFDVVTPTYVDQAPLPRGFQQHTHHFFFDSSQAARTKVRPWPEKYRGNTEMTEVFWHETNMQGPVGFGLPCFGGQPHQRVSR